ncbi:helix-turn-helix domain-containing protein [Kordia sp.]|uniref:helix-turn-helix domain-containing protein n=1 Tax=Kordia sp. TaxID=1965332 RepID=UPI003D6B6EBA
MKITLPFLYIFLFFSCSLLAQEKNFQIPDSLADKTNTELISLIKSTRYSDPEAAKIYTKTYYKKAIKEQNQLTTIDSYFYFGHIADIQGKYKDAISYINTGISLAENDRDSILGKLYNLRGIIQWQYGKGEQGIEDFNISHFIAQKYKDTAKVNIAEVNIALVKMHLKQYHESLKTYRKMLAISEDTTRISKNSRVSLYMGLCDNFLHMGKLDSALVYIDKGIKESLRINDNESINYLYPRKALYYYYKGDIAKALKLLKKSEKLITKLQKDDKRNIGVYYYMAQCYFTSKDYQAAIKAIEKALHIVQRENNTSSEQKNNTTISNDAIVTISDKDLFVPDEYIFLLKLKARCYEQLGDEKNQEQYFNQYATLKIESSKKEVRINNFFNLLDEVEEVAFMERQKLRKAAAETKVKYLYFILSVVSVAFLIVYLFFRKKEQQKSKAYKELIERISSLETKSVQEASKHKTAIKKAVNITDEKLQNILKGLEKFEAQELYLDLNCNLRFVAKKVKTNATYLSKIINEQKEISFTDYINNLRIQYTLKRLKSDSLFRAYSIKSISEEVGYRSADSFTKHFKKQTSLYPSYYIKKLNQEEV